MKRDALLDLQSEHRPLVGASKIKQVREVFEDSSHYLKSRSVDMSFRIACVQVFADTFQWHRLLDIGCGDGTITAPLMRADTKATLLDCSSSMCALARNNISAPYRNSVDVRHEDFSDAALGSECFDLIVTVGVMAHVDSPAAFLKKVNGLLRPDGRLILEFTDAFHPVGRVGRAWDWFKERLAPARYTTNKLSAREVKALLAENGLQVVSTYRYSRIPLPGIDRLMSRRLQYKLTKLIFGSGTRNRLPALGNEYICLLRSK